MEKIRYIQICTKYGSKFQEKTHEELLIMMLKAWTIFSKDNHKKNKIKLSWVDFEEDKPYRYFIKKIEEIDSKKHIK